MSYTHVDVYKGQAKNLVDGEPKELKDSFAKDEAESLKKQLEESGAVVEIK